MRKEPTVLRAQRAHGPHPLAVKAVNLMTCSVPLDNAWEAGPMDQNYCEFCGATKPGPAEIQAGFLEAEIKRDLDGAARLLRHRHGRPQPRETEIHS